MASGLARLQKGPAQSLRPFCFLKKTICQGAFKTKWRPPFLIASLTWSSTVFSFSGQITGGSHQLISAILLAGTFVKISPDNHNPSRPWEFVFDNVRYTGISTGLVFLNLPAVRIKLNVGGRPGELLMGSSLPSRSAIRSSRCFSRRSVRKTGAPLATAFFEPGSICNRPPLGTALPMRLMRWLVSSSYPIRRTSPGSKSSLVIK